MADRWRLEDFTEPIESGMQPPDRLFALSPERAAAVRERLAELAVARAAALAASHFYFVRGDHVG